MANGPIVATACYQHSLRLFLLSCSFIGVLSKDLADTYTIETGSLLPAASCIPSTIKDATKSPSMIVVHKYGPCAKGSHLKSNSQPQWRPTQDEILMEDQPRVEYINSHFNFKDSGGGLDPVKESKSTEIPAKMGSPGSGTYVVTLGLGQPVKNVTLIIDSGADLTWTHCKPCLTHCSQQQKPMYDPAESTSYHDIPCNSDLCYRAATKTGSFGHCNGSKCQYSLHYTDWTYTSGFLAMDKLTVAPTLTFDNFIFGCSQNNWRSFGGAAGYFGLGRGNLSLLAQDAATPTRSNLGKAGRYFSYCLPSSASSTGRIILGRGNRGSEFKFTPMITYDEAPSLYGINIVGISVDGKVLSIPSSTFLNAKPIIDSGTVITRLPPTAYAALRDAFRQSMSEYPRTWPHFMLDTCYNMSAYAMMTIPKVGFYFDTIGKIDLEPSGILYAASTSQVCLAFAGNHADTDVLIYGSVQQQSFGVIYDGELFKIGFAPNKC